ncbi:DNA-binding NarL/FixJ family response regulator [Kitasatospora sp. SolWspMP-SS2h]|uniref:response regulator transcription factor n=1 Tax=Kitasatospora sp. SolWspMP-SS2h TaxID=1305729 RepID=UPI000DB9C9BB|nr:response regulator transcription factor [Kitasatospora sp. SolWspMP-SS2h]RAJ38600.1 DNA-binding NarL/FixJ family response regulator [Kitasatospora sp. SolWspMP-SS2h]
MTTVAEPPVAAPRADDDWVVDVEQFEPRTSVLLADHDPISRRVLGTVLRDAAHLDYLRCVDSHRPIHEWSRLALADVVVLVVGPQDEPWSVVRQLVGCQVKVLLIGTDWSRWRVDAAFAAGATGCLVKDTEIARLASATRAVASGHVVLSPQVLAQVLETRRLSSVGSPSGPAPGEPRPPGTENPDRLLRCLTKREREVLELLADGRSTAEAAGVLKLSAATVKSHVSHALAKLGVRNRLEAVLLMQRGRAARQARLQAPPDRAQGA